MLRGLGGLGSAWGIDCRRVFGFARRSGLEPAAPASGRSETLSSIFLSIAFVFFPHPPLHWPVTSLAMESSRIFVRGLPPKFTEDDLRKHFAKYPVTDVKFFPHRRIGYVGYKTPEDASKAVKYFNKSFIKMTRIYVETARPVNIPLVRILRGRLTPRQVSDQNLPKSRRQRKEERTALTNTDYVSHLEDNKLKRKRDEEEAMQDPKLKEFLDVMQPPSKMKSWANEEFQHETPRLPAVGAAEEVRAPEGESDDEYQIITKKPKTSQSAGNPRAEPLLEQPLDEEAEEDPMEDEPAQEAQMAPQEEGPVSDADWLRSRTNRVLDLEDGDNRPHVAQSATKPPNPNIEDDAPPETQNEEQGLPDTAEDDGATAEPSEEEKIRQTGRLYLRNLPYDVQDDDLRDHFSKYGALEEVSSHLFDLRYRHYDEYPKIGTTDALHMRSTGRVF